jgi:hypothetical protein
MVGSWFSFANSLGEERRRGERSTKPVALEAGASYPAIYLICGVSNVFGI